MAVIIVSSSKNREFWQSWVAKLTNDSLGSNNLMPIYLEDSILLCVVWLGLRQVSFRQSIGACQTELVT